MHQKSKAEMGSLARLVRAVAKLHRDELTAAEMLGIAIPMWVGVPELVTVSLAEALERIFEQQSDCGNAPVEDAS